MPHIPKRHEMGKAAEVALLGSGIILISLVTGRSARRLRQVRLRTVGQVPEPESVRRNAPKKWKMDKAIRNALIGFAGAVLIAAATFGGAYINRSATPASSTTAPHSRAALPFNRSGFGCDDHGRRESALLRPHGGRPKWPLHSSCPEAPRPTSGSR